MALLHGRRYVLPSDIIALAPDVLRHRLVLSYAALADGITADTIVDRVVYARPGPAPRDGGGADRMTRPARPDRPARPTSDLARIGGRDRTAGPTRPGPDRRPPRPPARARRSTAASVAG